MSDETIITEGTEKVIRTYHNGRYEIRSKLNLVRVTDENSTLRGSITVWGLVIMFVGGICGGIYASTIHPGDIVPILNIPGVTLFTDSIISVFLPVGIVMLVPMDTLSPHTTVSETKNKLWVRLYQLTRSASNLETKSDKLLSRSYLFNANERDAGIKYLKEGITELELCIAVEEEKRTQPVIQERLHDDIIAGIDTPAVIVKPAVQQIPEKTYREDRFTDIDLSDMDD